ncbi:hypothetical protein [Puniceibacterium sediminis]|uniref:Saccharopine dehydrogenase NADP binding domain-containing protein n=1 Tax=Puniceibacterium sediminis TaxID=1608407 RepID=A0A238YT87_9RHOB|nr:hypothetical protein [Puniceibacterium sediminis]SNR74345.1 hypothetical protein SAMN06265370_1205 [Puniceibacterium sediminis]
MITLPFPPTDGALGQMTANGDQPRIMILGVGDLANHVINQLLARPGTTRLILAGRDETALRHRANLARYAAANCGILAEIEVARIDLADMTATAETLAAVKPDIIFMGASLQSWRRLTELPKAVFEALDEAQFGPWLPMHLSLNYNLMRSIRDAGITPKVVNAAFPDAVNAILDKVGLAPTLGVGNVANIIPGLTFAIASITGVPVDDLRVRLVSQHYFSHFVPRAGHKGNGDYHMSVTRCDGTPVEVDHKQAFGQLNGAFKRIGGVAGQLLTAGSATRVLAAMAENRSISAHVPGPSGLPGGYPVRISAEGATLDLPHGLSLSEAIAINQRCQQADGIEAIADDGTVTYTDREMAIMTRMLGYSVRRMALADTAAQANELAAKFAEFRVRAQSDTSWRMAG